MSDSSAEAPWARTGTVDGQIAGSKFSGSFKVDAQPGDVGDFEYRLIAKVPSNDISKTSDAVLVATLNAPGPGTFAVDIEIDPNDPHSADDKVTLESADGSYKQTKGVGDDTELGDAKLTLRFEGVDHAKRYTLTVDPGAEGRPYSIFENAPLPDRK